MNPTQQKPKPPAYSLEDLLSTHSMDIRQLVERIRQLVSQAAPDAKETAYPHWHGIGYRHPTSGYFCAIFPYDDRVNLSFEFGILLTDTKQILLGDGKQVRYVTFYSLAEIEGLEEALKGLIRSALELPERREVKLAMIRASYGQPPRR